MMKRISIFLLIVLSFYNSRAQVCTNLGQNPSTAFPVCGVDTFTQSTVPYCGGKTIPSPCTNATLTDQNPFWYKFTCYQAGTLGFEIIPNDLADDYDWQIFDITGLDPNSVFTNGTLFVACNWSGRPGITGASAQGTTLVNCAGDAYPTFSSMPTLKKDHEYLLLVSHFTTFSPSQNGYKLAFKGGTASITDPKLPALQSVLSGCGGLTIGVKLNKKMKCSSLAANGSDFQLSPANGTIVSAKAASCNTGFDMDSVVLVYPSSDLLLSIGYDTRRFDSAAITKILGHLKTLLESIVANPEQQLRDLSLLTSQESYQLLLEWNDTEVEYPQHQYIHQLFEAQVERTPDAIALVFEDEQLTYCELNKRANQLAHYLRKLGVGSEVLVGICVERSLHMIIGLLAILKAGGAYVPLDPSYPKERLAYMLEDSQPGVLLTQQHLVESLPSHKAKVICIDSNWELIVNENTENPGCDITGDNLAYLIYTSGSTGKPKGAMNTHQGACNRLLWMQDAYQLTATDSVLQKTPFSFDVSVWEFFWTLMTGARLVVAQPEGHRNTSYLVDLIIQQQITTLHFVPSMLQTFLEVKGLEKCQSLVRVMASGEALPAKLQQRFFDRLDAQLHNLYGPTEAAIDVTCWQCQDSLTDQKTIPIGRPIANTQIYLLDKYLNPVIVGVTGEVYIGGVGVGRGYLNRPELTAEKFIPNPFSKEGVRLYKTGDLARYLPNGEIEYIGRIDHQVKVRGFRIELGEIEAIISQHPAVRETVVVVRIYVRSAVSGSVIIVAGVELTNTTS
ncbi:hypothetical protein NUACC21_01740 [Scytonema sp. NUACC21]